MASQLSIQDANLSVSSINTTRIVPYKDIDLTFSAKASGDVYKKTDAAAVRQAVKNLILTNHFEKPFVPKFGANIRDLLFELADDDTEYEIESSIRSAIENYEPRAEVISVAALSLPERNTITATIVFRVINTTEEVTFTINLARLR